MGVLICWWYFFRSTQNDKSDNKRTNFFVNQRQLFRIFRFPFPVLLAIKGWKQSLGRQMISTNSLLFFHFRMQEESKNYFTWERQFFTIVCDRNTALHSCRMVNVVRRGMSWSLWNLTSPQQFKDPLTCSRYGKDKPRYEDKFGFRGLDSMKFETQDSFQWCVNSKKGTVENGWESTEKLSVW